MLSFFENQQPGREVDLEFDLEIASGDLARLGVLLLRSLAPPKRRGALRDPPRWSERACCELP